MSQSRNRTTLIGPDGLVSRRDLLHGALLGATAAGAGVLSAPAVAQYGGGPGAMPGAGGGAAPGPAPSRTGRGKVSKAAARYQDRPRGQQRCGRCAHFQAPNSCEIVAGRISPNGWSRFFKQA